MTDVNVVERRTAASIASLRANISEKRDL